jgi:hypothetical protein
MDIQVKEIWENLNELSTKVGAMEYDEAFAEHEEELGFIRDHLEDLSDRIAKVTEKQS